MNKARAIDLFDTVTGLANAVGCTPQAISKWPEELPRRIADRVIAAAVRAGKEVPPDFLVSSGSAQEAA